MSAYPYCDKLLLYAILCAVAYLGFISFLGENGEDNILYELILHEYGVPYSSCWQQINQIEIIIIIFF